MICSGAECATHLFSDYNSTVRNPQRNETIDSFRCDNDCPIESLELEVSFFQELTNHSLVVLRNGKDSNCNLQVLLEQGEKL